MTIDLGFAYLPVEAGPGKPPVDSIGFIDVPGHERFVRNLLCGLSGIDLALLVIAADDGPMPQTIEHLSILDLLEVPGGAVVLTRIDRVSDARIAQVRAQIEAMCVGTALSGAPVFPVCCLDGRGIDALKEHLLSAARASVRRSPTGNFRLSIDRVFSVTGTGLIVTGTAASGYVHIGDSVRAPDGTSLRVRSLHVHNRPAESGQAGQRCALNLAGPGDVAASIARGDWIVAPQAPLPTARWDVRSRVLGSVPKAVANGTPVSVHLGTARVHARIFWLEERGVDPGNSAFAQTRARARDRRSSRDPVHRARSLVASHDGGGRVIDIFAPGAGAHEARAPRVPVGDGRARRRDRTRAHARRLRELGCRCDNSVRIAISRRRSTSAVPASPYGTESHQRLAPSASRPAHWSSIERQAIETVAKWAPQLRLIRSAYRKTASGVAMSRELARPLAIRIARELALRGRLVRSSGMVRFPHQPRSIRPRKRCGAGVAPYVERHPLRPPSLHELATSVGEPPERVESALEQSARLGRVVSRVSRRYYEPSRCADWAKSYAQLRRQCEWRGERDRVFATAPESDATFRSKCSNSSTAIVLHRRCGNARRVMRALEDVLARTRPRRL